MKFKVKTLGYHYSQGDAIVLHGALGFEFSVCPDSDELKIEGEGSIELNTIDDVVDFISDYGEIIWCGDTITIYDGYNE